MLNALVQCSLGVNRLHPSSLQEALFALQQEKGARDEALAALEYQAVGREEERKANKEALEAERKAALDALAALEEVSSCENVLVRLPAQVKVVCKSLRRFLPTTLQS